MKRLLKILGVIVAVLALGIGGFTVWGYMPVPTFEPVAWEPRPPTAWPTSGWTRTTPEEQGMDSQVLLDMIAAYDLAAAELPELYLDSITVVRNGAIVAEFYGNPLYPPNELHVIHSVTKSIVSALVGIAIEEGHIEGVDVPVLDLFGDRTFANVDARKRALTLRDLLSMETGLHSRDSYLYAYENLFAMQDTDDWVQYALDLPMAAEPGERFDYSNISTFLIAAILKEATGTDPLAFAREHLFGPMGIQDVQWEWNADEQPIAWARMWLRPHDMAKIGLLYLQQGQWDGEQLLPAQWVRDSLTPHAYPKNAVNILDEDMTKNQEKSSENWVAQRFFRPFTDGYGYQWWLDRDGPFNALGTNGQFITVAPEQNLVFVVTAKSSGLATFFPAKLFEEFVLEAVVSDAPLPPNPAATRLAEYATPPPRTDERTPSPPLPPIAAQVSGVTWAMEDSPFNTDDIRFVFGPGDAARLSYTARESWDVDMAIGLDGVPRTTRTSDMTFTAVGSWSTPTTFAVDVEIVGYSSFDRWEFTFEGPERLRVTERGVTGDHTYAGRPR